MNVVKVHINNNINKSLTLLPEPWLDDDDDNGDEPYIKTKQKIYLQLTDG